MILYFLLPLPAVIAALISSRLHAKTLFMVWCITATLTLILMPMGSRDYATYLIDFDSINAQPLTEVLMQDPLYATAVWLFGHIGGAGAVFYAVLAALGLGIKLVAVRRLGGERSLPVVLYMCSFFFLHDFTQIRAGLAIGLWMLALSQLSCGPHRYLLLTGLATLIHVQAALGFILLGMLALVRTPGGLRAAALASLVVVLASASLVFDQWGYALLAAIPDPRTEVYLMLAATDMWVRPNPFNLMSMLVFLIVFGECWLRDRSPEAGAAPLSATRSMPIAVFLALLLGSCALALLSAVPVAAFRVSEHFFSLLPVGAWLAACRGRPTPRYTWPLWLLAALFLYIFLFHSPYLLDPATGTHAKDVT